MNMYDPRIFYLLLYTIRYIFFFLFSQMLANMDIQLRNIL